MRWIDEHCEKGNFPLLLLSTTFMFTNFLSWRVRRLMQEDELNTNRIDKLERKFQANKLQSFMRLLSFDSLDLRWCSFETWKFCEFRFTSSQFVPVYEWNDISKKISTFFTNVDWFVYFYHHQSFRVWAIEQFNFRSSQFSSFEFVVSYFFQSVSKYSPRRGRLIRTLNTKNSKDGTLHWCSYMLRSFCNFLWSHFSPIPFVLLRFFLHQPSKCVFPRHTRGYISWPYTECTRDA